MKKRCEYDYKTALKYALVCLGFIFITFAGGDYRPFSLCLLFSLLYAGFSIPAVGVLFTAPYIFSLDYRIILFAACAAVIMGTIFFFYRRKDVKMKAESLIYIICCLLLYVFFSKDGMNNIAERSVCALLTVILCYIALNVTRALFVKGLNFKPTADQLLCAGVMLALFGTGVINLVGFNYWNAFSVCAILFCCYIFGGGVSAVVSAALAMSACLADKSVFYLGVYALYAVFSLSFMSINRYLSPLAVLAGDLTMRYLLGILPQNYAALIFTAAGCVLFAAAPNSLLEFLKEKANAYKDRQLSRHSINRSRLLLSSRLLEISGVFREMENVFLSFNDRSISDDNASAVLTEEIINGVCRACKNADKCISGRCLKESDVKKLVNIGMAKGKVTMLDMPKDMAKCCIFPNNFLFAANKSLGGYRNYILENGNMHCGRRLIAAQAGGVSDILYQIALETNKKLAFDRNSEKKILSALNENGVFVREILCFYGADKGDLTVQLLTGEDFCEDKKLVKIISACTGKKMLLSEKTNIGNGAVTSILKPAPKYDAVFGVAGKTKDDSPVSGDTHSLIRLGEDKFMIAISDGMGSGEAAKSVSDSAISLIESFYKAGLESGLILDTVNKLLSINSEDTFSAIDICVVNLKDGSADFIKIGAPYGFVIKADGVKIVEGNSLPLGILEDIKPQITRDCLASGDMLLICSDGITGAFGSSADFAEFLQMRTAKNPQTLADEVLAEAVKLSKSGPDDDMTVVTLRIFGK